MKIKKLNSKGQTALEYALVVGVISVGVIFAGRAIFGKGGGGEKLMNKAVSSAQETIEGGKSE